ncbi:tartronate semialdehyde reductase [Salmonella enterica subsp. enterica]|uniref:Tartronate semialdehyde reductase n=1 Tax=Salmonella enterica I TaxID=59201 RepID=A0A447N3J7_SALET|nr:tartronate semialdehyde reductase [Salmonella enterica subsp. enterica]
MALNIAAMSEALTLATKAGVNPDLVYQAIRGGLAGSTVLDAKAPMVMDRNFKPGFRIDLHIKDLGECAGYLPRRWRAAPADRRRYGNDAGVTRGWTR